MNVKSFLLHYAAWFCLLALAVSLQMRSGNADSDKEWLLLTARLWLKGQKLYVQSVEVNPPLIVWIDALPVLFSLYIPWLKDYQALALLGTLCSGVSMGVSWALICKHPEFSGNNAKQMQWIMLLSGIFLIYPAPSYFFDKEFIFFIFIFPYVTRHLPSLAQREFPLFLRIIIGLMAALGFCLKPYCFVVFAAILLMTALYQHSLRTIFTVENILIGSGVVSYFFVLLYYYPLYFTLIMPMALATYSALRQTPQMLVSFSYVFLMIGIPFADFRLHFTSPYRKDIFYLLAIWGACGCYVLLNNGWAYTFLPLESLILVTTGFVGWEYLYLRDVYLAHAEQSRRFLFGARACIINLIFNISIGITCLIFTKTDTGYFEHNAAGRQYVEDVKIAGSFGTISMDFDIWAKLVRMTGAKWQTRFNHLWMIPKFFASDIAFAKKNQWIIEYVENAYAQDLNTYKPQLMFVDDRAYFYNIPKQVNLIAFLSSSPAFKAAWTHYRYVHSINECPQSQPPIASVFYSLREALNRHCSRDVYVRVP